MVLKKIIIKVTSLWFMYNLSGKYQTFLKKVELTSNKVYIFHGILSITVFIGIYTIV